MLSALREQQLARLLTELTDRVQAGEAIDLDGLCTEHPEVAEELRSLWGVAALANVAASSASEQALPRRRDCRTGCSTCLSDSAITSCWKKSAAGAWASSFGRRSARSRSRGQDDSPRPTGVRPDRHRFRGEAEAAARLDHPRSCPSTKWGRQTATPISA